MTFRNYTLKLNIVYILASVSGFSVTIFIGALKCLWGEVIRILKFILYFFISNLYLNVSTLFSCVLLLVDSAAVFMVSYVSCIRPLIVWIVGELLAGVRSTVCLIGACFICYQFRGTRWHSWGIARVRFPIVSPEYLIDLILLTALWP
jgi:hypothetical protein